MLARVIRVRKPKMNGIYLSQCTPVSSMRCWRCASSMDFWGQTRPSDVIGAAGRSTGPLWGRGRVSSSEQVRANQLVLRFSLPAGTYAISVLSDILSATEPDRRSESEEPAPAE